MSWNPQTQHLSGTSKYMADKYYNDIKKQNESTDTSKSKKKESKISEESQNKLEEFYKLSKTYSEKYPKYIEKVQKNEDYSELEKELNELIKEMNELRGINVQYNK
ncbi:hypothetical protein MTP04_24530 [Lysinibacillus sp. PLM2]|nr:hypothetical protein MTP04_24530 [Lysinibacillus sp. PLM2]